MTHAEAMVYAAAFALSYQAQRGNNVPADEAAQEATRKAWVTVAALRRAEPFERTASEELLAEFRAFGQEGAKSG